MDDDGACRLKEIRDAEAPTLTQDEKTSVVWGMPGAEGKRNAVDKVLALEHIPLELMNLIAKREAGSDKVVVPNPATL